MNAENRPEVHKILEHPYFRNFEEGPFLTYERKETISSQSTETISSLVSTPSSTPSRLRTE